jgi:uncharacterized RDD family membrane protein YckC
MSGEVLPGDGLPEKAAPTEICRCHSEPPLTELCESRTDSESSSESGSVLASCVADTAQAPQELSETWRDELSARLSQYRARRKPRPPRYPSLRLPFEPVVAVGSRETTPIPAPVFTPLSEQALALDITHEASPSEMDPAALPAVVEDRPSRVAPIGNFGSSGAGSSGAKIIEFPRFAWGPPPPPPDQLAEPVLDRLRILEVPEITPPPPALGGITIEAPERKETEKRPGIDVPLQTSSLARRVLASTIDALIVAAASALFGFIFWKVAAVQPPKFQFLGLAAGIPALFWAVYQYLLITYAANTPGLWFAGLNLSRFDGAMPRRSVRRWRVLASFISAASLGMGYAWVFLDEDGLCWHDRATHTHMARK